MGAKKEQTSAGAFFKFFDWSKRSRRKLFANGVVSPEETKQERINSVDLPAAGACPRRDDGDEVDVGSAPSLDGSSDCSCSSPVTAVDGMGTKAPGAVARLMGLDYMPIAGVTETCHEKKTLEGEFDEQSDDRAIRHKICLFKPLDLKHHTMPYSPIESFQKEILPPQCVKSLQITNCKLSSPVKTPYFISSVDAAHTMEAATEILEPSNQGKFRQQSSTLSSGPLRIRDKQDSTGAPRKLSGIPKSSAKPFDTNGTKCLISRPSGKSWSGSEDEASFRSPPTWNSNNSMHSKSKVKSTLSSSQTKININRIEGSSIGHDNVRCMKSSRSNSNLQSNKMEKNGSSAGSCRILKQNNLKQNTLVNIDPLPSNLTMSSHLREDSHSREGTSVKYKTSCKLQVKSKSQSKKECQLVGSSGKEPYTSQIINTARQKRITEGNNCKEKNVLPGSTWMSKNEKHIQHNIIVDKKPLQDGDRRINSVDVVSFTFTSPIAKSKCTNLSSVGIGKVEARNRPGQDSFQQELVKNTDTKSCSAVELNVMNGDALGILLEQKLRELTLALESPQNHSCPSLTGATSPYRDSLGAPETTEVSTAFPEDLFSCFEEGVPGPLSSPESPSVDIFGLSHKARVDFPVQEAESLEECNSDDEMRSRCIHNEDPSGSDLSRYKPSLANQHEAVPCSNSAIHSKGGQNENISCHPSILSDPRKWEIDYAREIVSVFQLGDKDPVLGFTIRNYPGLVFDQIEDQRSCTISVSSEDSKLNRKVLFDIVCEGLDAMLMRDFRLGSRSWDKSKLLPQGGPADEIYKDISLWRSLCGSMPDELVEKDMSIRSGRWDDFEIDVFEVGLEIEKELFGTLMSEMVTEFLA